MLKKAGIVVATAAAGLLALSPLAFADDEPVVVDQESTSRSVECDFDQETDNSIDQEGVGGSSLLGAGGPVTNTALPLNTNTQIELPIDSCNNDEDNDVTTSVEDSYNTED